MLLLLLALVAIAPLPAAPAEFRSHSHNDYLQPEPLATALANRMGSVEADVWLIDGELRVGHTRAETSPGRTLTSVYLAPLRQRVAAAGTRLYADGPPLVLLIDIKSEAKPAYAAITRELDAHAALLTQFGGTAIIPGAVSVVLSGNVPSAARSHAATRLAACDGRPRDLEVNPPLHLVPIISDNWTNHFQWNGHGAMPPSERMALRRLADHCHAQGRRLRLWAAPDTESSWREQFEAGVDLINTDRPAALHAFLASISSAP
ncbi:MAG TPA: phosphatidylinositol-specific phospholipase C/glycerophosphodiester phosphodiesterase family protein [Opitutaceae bacterium]